MRNKIIIFLSKRLFYLYRDPLARMMINTAANIEIGNVKVERECNCLDCQEKEQSLKRQYLQ